MGDHLDGDASATPYPRYSDSPLTETGDARGLVRDLVSTNNHKNDKLNELSQVEAGNEGDEDGEGGDGGEEVDDDWFSKLSSGRDFVRGDGAPDGTSLLFYGLNYSEIPLLCNEDLDFKEKTMKTLRVGLKKIWRRRSATITAEDPTYKVAYLGNVLTGWAKGEGCVDKPLNTLWKNYNSSTKPDVQMKISVTQSGLKAVTKDHGLIEYWSHRITYCAVPLGLPRIFCWVYRHEGRKLKQELRCHAVLCSKESVASRMATTLKLRLSQALLEFKRDKLLRQNARLSLANSVYENPSLPRRKILLSTGSHNYKPPLERSKSAPKLMSIEEGVEEEESTPTAKRKCEVDESEGQGTEEEGDEEVGEEEEEEEEEEEAVEAKCKKANLEERCEYKLANLNFVKKLCSSIENLVESTSNYSKKFLAERKPGKDFYVTLKRPEESILKKCKLEDKFGDSVKRKRGRKNVSFDSVLLEGWDSPQCTEYKRLEEEEGREVREGSEQGLREGGEAPAELLPEESDEGSNSLQSISSCCSDVSSLVTSSSERSADQGARAEEDGSRDGPDGPGPREGSSDRLLVYLRCPEGAPPEDAGKVVLHPTGEDRHCLEEGRGFLSEEDVASDESGFVDLSENLDRRLNLDSKEKDLPHHKIIKSTMLRPGRTKPSCLQV